MRFTIARGNVGPLLNDFPNLWRPSAKIFDLPCLKHIQKRSGHSRRLQSDL